jgi:hypothetical protein
MLYPPEVKIYADGRVVFGDKDGIWDGKLDQDRLERLKRDLANNSLLRKTALLPVRNGGSLGFHGGMGYIRYRDGDDEVLVAVLSQPRRGPYIRLLGRIRAEIPREYASFRPKSLSITVYDGATWRQPVPWPFSATIPIVKGDPITISDPAAAAFVIDHSFGGFSWLQANVTENGKDYSLMLKSVPGWYEPDELELKLRALRDENR